MKEDIKRRAITGIDDKLIRDAYKPEEEAAEAARGEVPVLAEEAVRQEAAEDRGEAPAEDRVRAEAPAVAEQTVIHIPTIWKTRIRTSASATEATTATN